jgi:TolB-like protein/DNA-binding winged helix-turn-helix (wHTH) protein/Tfp pilus assembly protein PilF
LKPANNTPLRIGDWRVDPAIDEISREGVVVKLEPRAMRLLLFLAGRAGQVVSVQELLDEVWADVVVTADSVYQAVAALRRLLGDHAKEPTYIVTLPRRGYRLVASVRQLEVAVPAQPTATVDANAAARSRRRLWVGAACVLLAGIVGLGWLQSRRVGVTAVAAQAPAATAKAILVLPFLDLSEKHDQGYFSDGLTEELIDRLARSANLSVISRTTSFHYRELGRDARAIGAQLGVTHLLEGSVRKSGRSLRITAQLVRTSDGYQVWSGTYNRQLDDIFRVQDDIAGSVVQALELKLQLQLSKHGTENVEAYNAYLLARQLFGQSNMRGFRNSVEAYQNAIRLDPNYAEAYAGLAYAEHFLADESGAPEGYQRSMAAAQRAVELAPDQGYAYAARADVRAINAWNFAGARADMDKAAALSPGDVNILRRHGLMLANLGHLADGIATIRNGLAINPLDSQSWEDLGLLQIYTRDYATAEQSLRRALQIQPDSVYAMNNLGTLFLLEGKPERALAIYLGVDDAIFRLAGVAMAQSRLGHEAAARQALDELVSQHAQAASCQIAEIYALRGAKDDAFRWLDKAWRMHDGGLEQIQVDPLFDSLRSDARMKALLRKMNLT